MSKTEVYLTKDEIEHPYANLAVMLEDKRRKAEQMSKTVFARITASPEVLAPYFVFLKAVFVTNYNPKQQWISTLTGEFYPKKAEAIAATVAKLKEVGDAK